MTFEICFNNQIHKISKNPNNFATLLLRVIEIFGSQLPKGWTLRYTDSDDHKIMLTNNQDYKFFLEELGNSSQSVKVFVMSFEETLPKVDLTSINEPIVEDYICIHGEICCESCDVTPVTDLTDIRYECSGCLGYDYCKKCEGAYEHANPFIKFEGPQEQIFSIFRNK